MFSGYNPYVGPNSLPPQNQQFNGYFPPPGVPAPNGAPQPPHMVGYPGGPPQQPPTASAAPPPPDSNQMFAGSAPPPPTPPMPTGADPKLQQQQHPQVSQLQQPPTHFIAPPQPGYVK